MAKVKGGLGKGLNALIPDGKMGIEKNSTKGNVNKININEIKPNKDQPRKVFNKEKLDALIESIKVHGVIQPIVVRPMENGYEIVAGERRWKASRSAGLKEIPCIIKEMDERQRMEIALIENLQREDLNPIEEALAYKTLMENYQLTQEEISLSIGKSRPYIANTVRLLNLAEEVRDLVMNNRLTSGHARALLRIEDMKTQNEMAKKVLEKGLSVRETEELVAVLIDKKEEKNTRKKQKDHIITSIEDALKTVLGTKVSIVTGKKKGKIEIEYYSDDELERLVELLQGK